MMGLAEKMNTLGVSDAVTSLTTEVYSTLDIAGMNYLDARYELDRTLFPNRVIVGSETFPTRIDELWELVLRHPHVIGDFTWTGWDYLGEVGIGRPHYVEDTPAGGPLADYPWLTSWAGDIDITGCRRPASYYREIVFGLRREPFIAVRRPSTRGLTPKPAPWSWTDSTPSWTWQTTPGQPLEVEVYSDADEVELSINGKSVGRRAVGPQNRYRAVFDVPYDPGELTATAIRDGQPAERFSLRTASAERRLEVTADRTRLTADGDIAFIEIHVVDGDGNRAHDADGEVEVSVSGSGALQALGSAAPQTEESFLDDRHQLFEGRALAVVRATAPGEITVTVDSVGIASASVAMSVT